MASKLDNKFVYLYLKSKRKNIIEISEILSNGNPNTPTSFIYMLVRNLLPYGGNAKGAH